MKTRVCKYCHKEKPIKEYEIANIVKGKKYRRWKCNTCYIERKSERRREIKKAFYEYKKTKKCIECGETDYRLLDFHHYEDNKEFNVADGTKRGYSLKRIIAEAEKCYALCVRCHRLLMFEEL